MMKHYFLKLLVTLLTMLPLSCSAEQPVPAQTELSMAAAVKAELPEKPVSPEPVSSNSEVEITAALFNLAQTERDKGFSSGLGFYESSLRESSGDYAGAVFAAFKELLWAYSFGFLKDDGGAVQGGALATLEKSLAAIKENRSGITSAAGAEEIAEAVDASLDFLHGNYAKAAAIVKKYYSAYYELDSFPAWLLLVCRMAEENSAPDAMLKNNYAALRSRYKTFPAYWYYAAKFAGSDKGEAASNAETFINVTNTAPSVRSPLENECRELIASYAGVAKKDASRLLTRTEIESCITLAVQENNAEKISPLLGLLPLPDNPYTLFAEGALQALARLEPFKSYLENSLATRDARMRERLHYIIRG
jgi:hypothetical protein